MSQSVQWVEEALLGAVRAATAAMAARVKAAADARARSFTTRIDGPQDDTDATHRVVADDPDWADREYGDGAGIPPDPWAIPALHDVAIGQQ